ncbi:MAG TPA: DHHA1 domain-containing protein [Pyrinomonadaceae bacterium]|nr:DHHA1 domain-containing protein [Pyrinomonadaceae bacterium]
MTTQRLYYDDSHLTEFEARVIAVTPRVSGWAAVMLDRTAFYPTGGGQPSDTGSLGNARVVECIDEEAGVLHVVQGRAPEVGATVVGHVDWPRRLDHLQQHTGQHILSQAFVALFQAETRSFRMMERVSEIDLALDHPTDERIERAVELANKIIWEDRPVHVRQVTMEEAAQLPLRKDSAREGELRIIEIEGFDLSPCGGTHAKRTGEVGLIAVRAWERAKGMTRIEFAAGGRALADYRRANRTARSVAAMFSVGRDEAHASVARLIEENKQLTRRVRALEEIAARVEADELLDEAASRSDSVKVIVRIFDGRDVDSLKRLALCIIAHPKTIVLFGSRDGDAARLVFARSADAPGDMNALMREACTMLEGRGGGRADMAQGGGRNVSRLTDAVESAARQLSQN